MARCCCSTATPAPTRCCEGEETAHLRQRAPRVVQFGITNRCNLACTFCSRDAGGDERRGPRTSAFDVLAGLADAGVLEVAFGGGEPWASPASRSWCAGSTTRPRSRSASPPTALALDAATGSRAVRGRYGQMRLSLYDDNDWRRTVARLADAGARFGVNYLVTPDAAAPRWRPWCSSWSRSGCRDVLLLSYNGHDRALHLDAGAGRRLCRAACAAARAGARGRAASSSSTCAGASAWRACRASSTRADCGAGREFLVLTSDRKVMPCSFHHLAFPVTTAEDVMAVWRRTARPRWPPRRASRAARARPATACIPMEAP